MTFRHPQSIALDGYTALLAGLSQHPGGWAIAQCGHQRDRKAIWISPRPLRQGARGQLYARDAALARHRTPPSRHCQQPLRHPRDRGLANDRRGPSLFQRRAPTSRLLNLWGIIAYCRHCIGARGGATPCLTRDAVGLSPPDRNWDSALSAGSQDEAFMRSIRRRSQ